MKFFKVEPDTLQVRITAGEWEYAQRYCFTHLPHYETKEWDGIDFENVLTYRLDSFNRPEIPRFLAYIGKLEVFHLQFLLRTLHGQSSNFAGSGGSAARFLRRIYKRLTAAGKRNPESYVCDEKADEEVTLIYHHDLKLLALFPGRNARLLIGQNGQDLAMINEHFSKFGITVEVVE